MDYFSNMHALLIPWIRIFLCFSELTANMRPLNHQMTRKRWTKKRTKATKFYNFSNLINWMTIKETYRKTYIATLKIIFETPLQTDARTGAVFSKSLIFFYFFNKCRQKKILIQQRLTKTFKTHLCQYLACKKNLRIYSLYYNGIKLRNS